MRIMVISGLGAGSQLAHAINTVKMAQGFARLGHDVTLVCQRDGDRRRRERELREIYGLTTDLRWIVLRDRLGGRPVGQHWKFAALALPHVVKGRPEFVFTRSYWVPRMTSRLGVPTAAETHAFAGSEAPEFLGMLNAVRRPSFRCLVTISPVLAEYYASRGAPSGKILVLPDAVDVEAFRPPREPGASPYEGPGPHIVYSGHLYDYKGIPTLLEAAQQAPDLQFHFVGGTEEDLQRQREAAERGSLRNVTFHGMKRQCDLPPFLWHADVLVLPPSGAHPSAAWTSPVKLGEYLISGRPVVMSDIPALKASVPAECAEYFEADRAGNLVDALRRVLHSPERRAQLVLAGGRLAETLSYESRARKILEASGLRAETRIGIVRGGAGDAEA